MGHDRILDMEDAVKAVLAEVGERLALHAGGIELVDFSQESGVIRVKLVGTCGSCPLAAFTLKHGVESVLKERLPWVTQVIAVT